MRGIILLALLGSALAAPSTPSRIVGGSAANIEDYPYMASLQMSWDGLWWFHSCGGSLITSTAVLTAAHCYYGDYGLRNRVSLGSSLTERSGSLHTVSRIIMHPQYDPTTVDNDIAILRLGNPAVFSDRVRSARIPGPNYNLTDGASTTHLGWGRLGHMGPHPEQLMQVHVDVINQELCVERYAYLKTQPGFEDVPRITDGMVCAGILDVGGKDACQGDSGGPLAHFGDIIVGIISWGYQCGDPIYPGVNARVSHFSNWIVANAN